MGFGKRKCVRTRDGFASAGSLVPPWIEKNPVILRETGFCDDSEGLV